MRSRRKGTHSVGDIIIHFKLEQRISRFIEQIFAPMFTGVCLQVCISDMAIFVNFQIGKHVTGTWMCQCQEW